MRIAQIIAKGMNGGVEAVVSNYYKNMNSQDIHIDIFIENESKIINKKMLKNGDNIYLVPSYKKIFKYIKIVKFYFKKNDYDIVHSNISTMSFIPLCIAKHCGIKNRIAHSHSTSNKKEVLRKLLKLIFRHLSNMYTTDYFACGKDAAIFQFGKKRFEDGKVFILNNAIEYDEFSYNNDVRNQMRKKYKFDNSNIVIGNIGRFVKQKNHLFLIDVFKQLFEQNQNYRLFLVGVGGLKEEVMNKVKILGLDKYVLFLSETAEPGLFYQMFDLFLLPSLYEGLPVVGIEAQVNGLPCVFSTYVTREIKIRDNVYFFEINDKKKFADNIIANIIFNRESNNISEKFDISKQAIHLKEKYLEINS